MNIIIVIIIIIIIMLLACLRKALTSCKLAYGVQLTKLVVVTGIVF